MRGNADAQFRNRTHSARLDKHHVRLIVRIDRSPSPVDIVRTQPGLVSTTRLLPYAELGPRKLANRTRSPRLDLIHLTLTVRTYRGLLT